METEKQFPACFGSRKDYELWLDSSLQETDTLTAKHCTDCLPSFKMRMAATGRCSHPETRFLFAPSEFDGLDGVEISGQWTAVLVHKRPRGRPRKPRPEPKAAPQAMGNIQAEHGPEVPGSPAVAAAPVVAPKPPKQKPTWKPSFWDLQRAIAEGFDIDPTPITVADMTEICRTDGSMKVGIADVMRAMRQLWTIGVLERGARLCQKRQSTVDHYWGKKWKAHAYGHDG